MKVCHLGLATALLAATVLLEGCAGTVKGDCTALAGPGWSYLSSPPPAGPELLKQINLPDNAEVAWFAQGDSKLFVCNHGYNLVNPSCGGSTGYQYDRVNGQWISRGVSLPLCINPNTQ